MGVQNPNSTNYVHPDEPNLLNIHKAMTYDATGEPHLRVTLGSDTITINGDVNLVDNVRVNNSTTNPVPVFLVNNTVTILNTSFAITNFPTTSTVYQGTSPWVTTITNWPALQYVNGVLYAVQSGTWNVNVTSLPAVSGTVVVSSLPAVTGTVAVSNFTSTVNIASMPAVSGTVSISNFPTSVTVTNFTSTVNIASMPAVSGTVAVSSLPAVTGTVTVNGSVTVTNFTSTVNVASLPAITGTVVVSNFTSTVRVDNFPTSVTVTNFTSTVFVSNTLTISNTSFAVTNFPTTSTVFQGTVPWQITGTVVASNFTSTVNINSMPSITISTITFSNTSIAITNFPTTSTVYQGTTPWNITGTVAISSLPEVEIKNDSGNPIPVSGNITATIVGTVTSTVVDGAADAFGRLRVSEAFTLGDYKHTYGIDPNFRDTLSNGGTVTHITNQAAARLATTNNASSRAIHQTKMYHNYMPGKSQLIKSTINFYGATTNVTKRTGYYDDLNGIYFEQTGTGELAFVIRTDTSGTASDARRAIQSSWNKDRCDGTGPSGFNLDITKTQIFFTDFQWLGVGRVRCGFVHDGQTIVAHEFYNSNNLPTVYMSNPNLPIRCEILNTGATAGAFFDQICSTVVSEGGYVESGIDFSVDSGQTSQSITVANGMYPIVAIRLKNTFRGYPNRVVVRSGNINVYAEEYPAYWALFKLSDLSAITLSSSTWTSASADSAVEYNLTATAFTGGDRIDGGIVGTTSPGGSAKGTGTAPVNQPSNAKKNFIAQNQGSTNSEIYVVCGKAIGGTSKLWVDFQWREIY
jgi:hypothetical protein